MIGFEIDEGRFNAMPAVKESGKLPSIFLAKAMLDAGLMVVPAGPKVVRWLPPLNISQQHVSEGLALLQGVLNQLG